MYSSQNDHVVIETGVEVFFIDLVSGDEHYKFSYIKVSKEFKTLILWPAFCVSGKVNNFCKILAKVWRIIRSTRHTHIQVKTKYLNCTPNEG